jgi:septum formation inhibitor-activating ATPase MinD
LLQLVSGVSQAIELDEILVVEEAARLEEALLKAAEDEAELVVAAAELEAEEDCD